MAFDAEKALKWINQSINPSKFLNNFKLITTLPETESMTMSDREPTRWQHNHIYPYPKNPCMYTSICHLQISI